MNFSRYKSEIQISALYLLFGGLWILLSDKILALFVSDPHVITQIQTYKGWFFVLSSAILIYILLHRHMVNERLATQNLKDNEEKFRLLYSMSNDAILLTSPDGSILAANPAACKMFDRTEEEFREIGREGLVDQDDPAVSEAIKERETKGIFSGVLTMLKKDGTKITCEASSSIYFDSQGLQRTSMVIRDISDRIKAAEDLNQSENKFSILFKKAPFASTLSDLSTGAFLEVNEKFEKVYGYSREEAIGKTTNELKINPDNEGRAKVLAELRENQHVRSLELELQTKSGNTKIMSVNIDVVEFGGKKYLFNASEDITEQKQNEIILRKSEENLKKAQVYANIGSWTWLIPTNKLEWSDQMFRIFGLDKETFTGNLSEVVNQAIHPDDREAVNRANESVVNQKNPAPLIYRIIWPDGTIRTVWAEAGELTLDKAGEPKSLSGVVQDITERMKNEEKIELQSKALEAAANAIMITDVNGVIQWVNRAFTSLAGYEMNEIVGRSTNIQKSGQYTQEFYQNMWDTVIKGNVWHGEVINRHKNGHLYIEEETITPITNSLGKITHFIGIKQDISKRKESEKLLRESEERLRLALIASHQGIFDLNVQTGEAIVNDIYANMLGYDPETFVETNQKWRERLHPEDRVHVELIYDAYIDGRIPEYKVEFRQKTTSGKWIWILSNGKIVEWDAEGLPLRMLGTHADITESKESALKITNLLGESQRRLKRIETLREIDLAISSNFYLNNTLDVLLNQVTAQLGVDAATILLYDESSQIFEYADSLGFPTERVKNSKVKLGDSLAGTAASTNRIVHLQNIAKDIDPHFRSLLAESGFQDYFGIPLVTKGNLKGVLELFNKTILKPDNEWLHYYETLAGQAAIAIENSQLIEGLHSANDNLLQAYDATIEGWSKALDLRDKETEGHTLRVSKFVVALAKKYSFSDTEIEQIKRGALLHDIGKMGIPDSILLKTGLLTDEERKIMQYHPKYAFDMLKSIDFLKQALEIPHLHHEKWDGTGYPYGIKGEKIPLTARLFAIVDVYDALTSDRPYRSAWTKQKALGYIQEESGKHFDPEVVKVFMEYVTENKLNE